MDGRRFISSLPHPHHHLEAWQAIFDAAEPYPGGVDIAPFRRPRSRDRLTPLTTARLSRYGRDKRATTHGYVLELFDERQHQVLDLPDGPDQAEQLRAVLFTQANKGRMIVFANEKGTELAAIWESFALAWAAAGYELDPIGPTTGLYGLVIKRSKQVWRLCSAPHVTGVALSALRAQNRILGPRRGIPATAARRLWVTLDWLQRQMWEHFGVSFKMTISRPAVKAAAFHMPENGWLWRPNPLLVSMLRFGGGFRGGHAHSTLYRGPAWHIDVRRMYTSILAKPLPLRVSWGVWQGPDDSEGGVFMCTIKGTGKPPIYISTWNPETSVFEHGCWAGGECVAVLTSDEVKAIGRLGYLVLPGYGFHFWRTFSLKTFVDQLQNLTRRHGPKSALGLMCKKMGNAVYGRWSQSPHRWDLAFSIESPGEGWMPFSDERGDELPHLWTAPMTRYSYTQHVELAAVVTAYGRAMLYDKMADLLAAGHHIIKANTDALWIAGLPPPGLVMDGETFGSWRLEGVELDTVILPTGAYIFGPHVKRPGARQAKRAELYALYDSAAPSDAWRRAEESAYSSAG